LRAAPLSFLSNDTPPFRFFFFEEKSSPSKRDSTLNKHAQVPEIRLHMPNTPFILLGTKMDLREDERTIESLKQKDQAPVTHTQGMEMCKKMGGHMYIECSALTMQNVDMVFDEVVRCVIDPTYPKKGKKGENCVLF